MPHPPRIVQMPQPPRQSLPVDADPASDEPRTSTSDEARPARSISELLQLTNQVLIRASISASNVSGNFLRSDSQSSPRRFVPPHLSHEMFGAGSKLWDEDRNDRASRASTPTPRQLSNVSETNTDADGDYEFVWNSRLCHGGEVHRLVLFGEARQLEDFLQESPEAAIQVCSYTTWYKDARQEGSAQPIHLAASRDSVEKVKLLIQHGASVRAMVTRAGQPHYDVMSAAVFAEGRGGSVGMVKLLMQEKAELKANLDNKTPLHLAYQVGCLPIIELLYSVMKKPGIRPAICLTEKGKHESPLECGISSGRMSQRQLALVAPATPSSLETFMEKDPGCLPAFLERIRCGKQKIQCRGLANVMSVKHVCNIMKRDRGAAGALLDAVTDTPEVEHAGFHPLPIRIIMEQPAEGVWRLVPQLFTDPLDSLSMYEVDHEWLYCSQTFHSPAWHQRLSDGGLERRHQTVDVDIKVCHVPNLLCAEFFEAMVNNSKEEWAIYDNEVVKGLIQHAWQNGASTVNFYTVFVSIWVLACLLLENWIWERRSSATIAMQFVWARGIVDLQNEVGLFYGYARIHCWKAYWRMDAIKNIVRYSVPLLLMMSEEGSRWFSTLLVVTVLICWLRFLGAFGSAERIAKVLFPLMRLALALRTALAVTLMAFAACFHAFLLVDNTTGSQNGSHLFNTFTLLVTASIPALESPDGDEDSSLIERAFGYLSVCVFTVFLLNIFIAILGEQYSLEVERSQQTFLRARAHDILTYLLRSKAIPGGLTPRVSRIMSTFGIVTGLSAQIFAYWCNFIPAENDDECKPRLEYGVAIFWLCLTVLKISSYRQHSNAPWMAEPWGRCKGSSEPHEDVDRATDADGGSSNDLWEWTKLSERVFGASQSSDVACRGKHYLWIAVRAEDGARATPEEHSILDDFEPEQIEQLFREELAKAMAERYGKIIRTV